MRLIDSREQIFRQSCTMRTLLAFIITLSFFPFAFANDEIPIPGIGPVSIKKLATSGGFTEGPASLLDGSVVFSDMNQEKVYHVDLEGNLSVFIDKVRRTNGLFVDLKGQLFACETRKGDAAVVRFDLETKERTVVAGSYQGKPFNRVNDLVIDREGGIYFSDIMKGGPELPQPDSGVYYVSRDGEVTKLIENMKAPNGVLLSRDETSLFVAAMGEQRVARYPILEPGKVGEGRTFYEFDPGKDVRHGGDGMAIDVNGNFYFAQFRGQSVHVVNPHGELLGIIPFETNTTNCAFGGKDGRTLYVTSGGSIYALRMEVPGHRFPGRL